LLLKGNVQFKFMFYLAVNEMRSFSNSEGNLGMSLILLKSFKLIRKTN